ncbi:PEGA domain-containing protein [bacterium]|nr:PEGA domain-containing protein [bacterium]
MKGFQRKVLPIILTLTTVSLLTTLSMFYAKGYRFIVNPESEETISIEVKKTGILAVRSIPDTAKILLNGELKDVTNTTLSSLTPGKYLLQVEKAGYEPWKKDIEVFEDLVTDITATLVLKGGGLNPLTNGGVLKFQLSNNGEHIAYTSKGEEKSGLWVLQLSNRPVNIFQTNKKLVAVDQPNYSFSDATDIVWSPDDQKIMLKFTDNFYMLVDLSKPALQAPVTYTNPQDVFTAWKETELKNKRSRIISLEVPAELTDIAITGNSTWSPDGEKFYYLQNTDDNKTVVKVYDFKTPLPIGESRYNEPLIVNSVDLPKIFWFSDSEHLLLVKGDSVSFVRIDGSNFVEVFNGSIIGDKAYPTPGGDRIVILSKFKSDTPENLYTISIR